MIFEPTDKVTNFDKNFFIPDSINKFCYFDNNPNEIENYHYNKKINQQNEENENNVNNDNKDNEDAFYLDKNTLCVIEIKNQFPPYRSNKIQIQTL